MEPCKFCGALTYSSELICPECRRKIKQEEVLNRSTEVKKCSDFKSWSGRDLSEIFWIHLGRYVKESNPESLNYMNMAVAWARHADGGLANSFSNALLWAGLDLWEETRKWSKK